MRKGATAGLHLVARRHIAATPEEVFAAWTEPEQLKRWWGPAGITCPEAEIDLREGGRYRIADRDAEGRVLWIGGVFERVEAPHRLVYTWAREPVTEATERSRVTVRFTARGEGTEVVVVHERLLTEASRERHARGWAGCLDGLGRSIGTGRAR